MLRYGWLDIEQQTDVDLLKWYQYPEKDNRSVFAYYHFPWSLIYCHNIVLSWEPEENLASCQRLIQSFWQHIGHDDQDYPVGYQVHAELEWISM
jgi:hypothetical protein